MSGETHPPVARTIARVKTAIGARDYRVDVQTRHHVLITDEPKALGGKDVGLASYDYLLSDLGACTAITVQIYAKRKKRDLRQAHVELRFTRQGEARHIERVITLKSGLTSEQRARLTDIAGRTPVTADPEIGHDDPHRTGGRMRDRIP